MIRLAGCRSRPRRMRCNPRRSAGIPLGSECPVVPIACRLTIANAFVHRLLSGIRLCHWRAMECWDSPLPVRGRSQWGNDDIDGHSRIWTADIRECGLIGPNRSIAIQSGHTRLLPPRVGCPWMLHCSIAALFRARRIVGCILSAREHNRKRYVAAIHTSCRVDFLAS